MSTVLKGEVFQRGVWPRNVCCLCNRVASDPRYTPFEGRTGASTVPTSCGASSPKGSAAQVTVHSQHLHCVTRITDKVPHRSRSNRPCAVCGCLCHVTSSCFCCITSLNFPVLIGGFSLAIFSAYFLVSCCISDQQDDSSCQ